MDEMVEVPNDPRDIVNGENDDQQPMLPWQGPVQGNWHYSRMLAGMLACALGAGVFLSVAHSKDMLRRGDSQAIVGESLDSGDAGYDIVFNSTIEGCLQENAIPDYMCYSDVYGRHEHCWQLRNDATLGSCEAVAKCLQGLPFTPPAPNPCVQACKGSTSRQITLQTACQAQWKVIIQLSRICVPPSAARDQQLEWRITMQRDYMKHIEAKCLNLTTTTTTTTGGSSLFCFALIVPWTAEVSLIGLQSAVNSGIFRCEGSAIYSDRVMNIGNITTRKLENTNLHCSYSSKTHTAMNTWIFKNLWMKVIDDGDWKKHDWIAKVDADSMFLPQRLRYVVRDPWVAAQGQKNNGAFLNNCKFGLHGPIEVMSRRAMEVLSHKLESCKTWPPQEDVYIQQCLKSNQVIKVDAFNLLKEKACGHDDYWNCQGDFVAFHPFKHPNDWQRCNLIAHQQ